MNLYHKVYTRWRTKHTPDLIAVFDRNAYLMFTYDGDEAAAVDIATLDILDNRRDVLTVLVLAPCGEGRARFVIRSRYDTNVVAWHNNRWTAAFCTADDCMDEETKALRRQFAEVTE